jgi:hypothetical protein
MRHHNATKPHSTYTKNSRNTMLAKPPRQSRGYGDLVVIGAALTEQVNASREDSLSRLMLASDHAGGQAATAPNIASRTLGRHSRSLPRP